MTEESKKRILYVGRDYFPDRHMDDVSFEEQAHNRGYESFISITDALSKKFELETCLDLDWKVEDLIERRIKENKKFNALITHVPYDKNIDTSGLVGLGEYLYFSAMYGKSLNILKKIKEMQPEMPIIAYTGANNIPIVRLLFKNEGKIDEIVFKSKWKENLIEIESSLYILLKK